MPLSILSVQRRPATRVPARIAALERAGGVEQREVVLGAGVGVLADHERQVDEALVLHQVDDGAVGGDDEELAVVLPERVRLALG